MAGRDNPSDFYKILAEEATEIKPTYSHSGSVVAVTMAYLEEHGVGLLRNVPEEQAYSGLDDLGESDSLLTCIGLDDAEDLRSALKSVTPLGDELRLYFESFTEEQWSEAGTAMQEAIRFIKQGLEQLTQPDKWLLIFIG